MDVADEDSVREAFARIDAWCPDGLDAVVTFAGVGVIGPLMDLPVQAVERVLDVNVLGTHRTVRGAWPLLRRAGGRVVLIGSETGSQHAFPLNGPYAMSKHAIEAYADALRRELMFVGIQVVLLQPGPFRTTMTTGMSAAFEAVPADSPVKGLANSAVPRVTQEEARMSDPALLAEVAYRAATARRPRHRYSVLPHRERALLSRLPVPVVDALIRWEFRRRRSREA